MLDKAGSHKRDSTDFSDGVAQVKTGLESIRLQNRAKSVRLAVKEDEDEKIPGDELECWLEVRPTKSAGQAIRRGTVTSESGIQK